MSESSSVSVSADIPELEAVNQTISEWARSWGNLGVFAMGFLDSAGFVFIIVIAIAIAIAIAISSAIAIAISITIAITIAITMIVSHLIYRFPTMGAPEALMVIVSFETPVSIPLLALLATFGALLGTLTLYRG